MLSFDQPPNQYSPLTTVSESTNGNTGLPVRVSISRLCTSFGKFVMGAFPRFTVSTAASSILLLNSVTTVCADESAPSDNYGFGGYIKFDAMFSEYSDGQLTSDSHGSQFYIPAKIPIGGAGDSATTFQARESRISFKSNHMLANAKKASTFIEVDFFLGPGGDERVSNSYEPRLRHAFFTYDKWLFGQTWSTFQDIGALPDNLDFIGPAESTVFVRQAQIRYTSGPFEFAAENPETTLTPYGESGRIIGRDGMPDFVARYTARIGEGYIKAAGMVRELKSATLAPDESEFGYGLSISGKHPVGDDDVRWMATYGSGTGRYLGLNTANGASLDSNGSLEAIDQFGAFVSYRHMWNDKYWSNITYGFLQNDHNLTLTSTDVTKDVTSVHLNLQYAPVPEMMIGAEILFAKRNLESGASGDMARFILSAKYVF